MRLRKTDQSETDINATVRAAARALYSRRAKDQVSARPSTPHTTDASRIVQGPVPSRRIVKAIR